MNGLVVAAVLSPGGLIVWLIVGALAGSLAGHVVRGRGFGLLGDIVLGILGAIFGNLALNALHVSHRFGFVGTLVVAFVGACVLIALAHLATGSRGSRVRLRAR